MKKLIIALFSLLALTNCNNSKHKTDIAQWLGDCITTIDSTAYYWLQLSDDSARISAVKDNKLVTECIIKGPVYGAKQYDDGEIYILCGQNQTHWFDVRHIPSEIFLMTEEDLENYDLSQENADAIININTADVFEDEEMTDDILHIDMTYFNFDNIKNLVSFFEDIESRHEKIVSNEEGESTIDKCIMQIEKYRNGKRKYFPDSLVSQSLWHLGYAAANIYNHRPGVDLAYAEWFMMLVAYYSPDISYMVDMQSPDHLVGVRNFGNEYNNNPWWSYLFVRRTKGYEVRNIGGDYTLVTKLFQLEDTSHRKYYLCSNNNSELSFMHYLYTFDRNEKLIEVKPEDIKRFPDVEYDEIYFSPERLEWSLCKQNKNSGKLIPVTDKPFMKLKLNGKESEFTIFY